MANRMSKAEFIALVAMMFATIAFSIDSMLPALPEIGAQLSPDDINRAQLILTSFVLGMGIGTFFTGPISDALGRKPVIFGGALLYIAASAVAWASSSLELVLIARVVQGLGAAGPRVVAMAIIRDLYSGREMARIISIAMMIFTLVPAIAPMLGAGVIALFGWRGIFVSFILFALIVVGWMSVRLPESLAVENRRPFRLPLMIAAVQEMFAHPTVRLSILVQTLCMGMLFTMLTMVQPVYDVIHGRADSFPFWFGFVALMSGSASLLNAALVVRVGMRRMVTFAFGAQIAITSMVILLNMTNLSPTTSFALFVFWQTMVFFMAGITIGNLNAIAMEPMGHIAGMAASVIGSISTVLAAAIAAPIGLLFDGSIAPLTFGILTMCVLAFGLMLHMGRVEQRLPA
ncbi:MULTISPECIES: multidrug effflux MFS transporter [unclassified Ruegeria]|uniref:multidrug effflux MFS transporter n=1 Tax=unclassified Ruegeria TaxID=2625375 RepID=UPI0014895C45|nr:MULTISPECIES: multidrug effflux MFS transporter [unclassified Ruegeria]NOD63174.1 MFS transporter [Ruegeria sp. HKCCD6109]NOD77971.1 MFS transporter [Ruegeria sp. HKCCD4332]NOD87555.1 MFS transporter [Ruegeria sp. HKCCD4318]NOE15588.1 MFS transporter [Ruegeria sp. HKCCD4318-2]NOG08721.1 multidrug effflux MFS transporter [Ruegeria sp. HKCCD4315]